MQWIEISVVCERVVTDEVTALFHDMTDNGIIEEDVKGFPTRVKLTMYTDPLSDTEIIEATVKERFQKHSLELYDVSVNLLDEKTWYRSWQQYIEPVEILPRMVIKPVWQDYQCKDDETVVEIDTDLSFGTGSHETTRSCAVLLKRYIDIRKGNLHTLSCLDIGTGTGILLLIAAKLGIQDLTGIDIDPDAAEQARINCVNNDVKADIICGDLVSNCQKTADIILANLTADPLKNLLPLISSHLNDEGLLIISGIIDDRYDEIMPYITAHWHIEEELREGSWHTFALRKPE